MKNENERKDDDKLLSESIAGVLYEDRGTVFVIIVMKFNLN